MAKKTEHKPLVTSVSTTLKKTYQSPTQVVSVEDVKQRKKDMLDIVDKSLEIFKNNLANGKVSLNSSIDLERITKLMLILSGEPDSVVGQPNGEQVTTTESSIELSRADQILDRNDPEVQAMFKKLYEGYNKLNDEETEE